MKIPLAWRQLTHNKVRLLVAVLGISFADILMFMQLGFLDALFDSSVILHERLNGDIFLINPQSNSLVAMKSFSRRYLYKSLAVRGVESASPVYLEFAFWKNPFNKSSRAILVLGINPQYKSFNFLNLSKNIQVLKEQDVVLFDEQSRPEFGAVAEEFRRGKKIITELKGKRVKVAGLFSLGTSFSADGNVLTSDLNFLRIFNRHRDSIEIGVIKLTPEADLLTTQQALRQSLPQTIKVLNRTEFMDFEKQYWENSTSIGFIFFLGTTMGFIVGIVIVYQILYTDVDDHLSEYATLKAMGYRDLYFVAVIFQEAVILAFLGYLPGVFISISLYSLTASATSLPMFMTATKSIVVLVSTIIMCCVSGIIAMNKLKSADPADCF
ncbi:ABC transporter permease DevC [Nostoc sp. UHCC 0252]|uniref:ABC transporter permease DevC n=1 Tax=Nostoc sp. UHCC 0252 TaxID=3110241 RepID=UPI002B1F49E2|nr:ABC transporter permease DevC [Nostoc sp. UHCC 0252]MEA5605300.1 ABC transporter permease DevC [Nostoc sp. UHCC 0252]